MNKENPARYSENPYPVVNAIRFIRSLPGGSQSILALCDNGCYYVVKMKDNPQGQNTLANEVLGNRIVAAMGLPVAPCAFVRLSSAFITAMYPSGWFHLGGTHPIRPKEGLHLGSRFVGWPDGEARTSDYIGRSQLKAIVNREDFIGMLVVDAWADHRDQRQAAFYSESRPGPLHAVFIDHGLMFGGKECIFRDDKCRAFFYDFDVYKDAWSMESIGQWKDRLRSVAGKVLQESYKFVPPSWYDDHHRMVRSTLIDRLELLSGIFEPYLDRLIR